MEGWYEHLRDIEKALKYCPCIQELSLNIHNEIEKQYRLKTLRIQTSCPADYLQYLFYKYPNIESINIDVELDDEFIEDSMNRIASLIKDISNKQIIFTVETGLDLREIVQSLQAYSYDVIFDIMESFDSY